MCIQVVERYSVCKCLYHRHSIDPCAARNTKGHTVQEKTVYVGYTCAAHSKTRGVPEAYHYQRFPDSGYSSGGFNGYHDR